MMVSCFCSKYPQNIFQGLGHFESIYRIHATEPLGYVLPLLLFGVQVYFLKGKKRQPVKADCIRHIHLSLMPLILIVGVS